MVVCDVSAVRLQVVSLIGISLYLVSSHVVNVFGRLLLLCLQLLLLWWLAVFVVMADDAVVVVVLDGVMTVADADVDVVAAAVLVVANILGDC